MKTRLFLISALVAPALYAQDAPKISYESFHKWMKGVSCPGYKLMECEKDGNEHNAAFMGSSPEDVLMVRCGLLESFDELKKMPGAPITQRRDFEIEGCRAISFLFSNIPMLQIELKAKSASLTIAGPESMPFDKVEKLASSLKIAEYGK